MKHRDDIDGMRALAVLAIVAYHINPVRVAGGFVGVDVFFVISGFLITSITVREISLGSFSFAVFYAKRIKRLFPALFAMLAICWLAGYFLLLPPELVDVSRASIASVFYLSNFYFYSRSGYFDSSLDSDPLVHTWSLGVEEQFYLVFPVILVVLSRMGVLPRNIGLLVLGIMSLALAQFLLGKDPSAAFYFSPARFWQFCIGAGVALAPVVTWRRITVEGMSAFGVLLVVGSIFLFSKKTPFPGIYAMVPSIGIAAVIYAGRMRQTISSRILAFFPFTYTGRISYSVYLWHWPLIVFYKLTVNTYPAAWEQLGLLSASLVLGAISFALIETPTSRFSIKLHRRALFVGALTCTTIVVVAGTYVISNNGFASRFPSAVQHYSEYLNYADSPEKRLGVCFLTSGTDAASFQTEECTQINPDRRNAILIGDSHAAHLYTGLKNTYSDVHFSQVNASGCRPILPFVGEKRCTTLFSRAFTDFIPAGEYDTIILSARWRNGDERALQRTIEKLQPFTRKVVVFGPIIEYNVPLPRLLASAVIANDPTLISAASNLTEVRGLDVNLRSVVESTNAEYISVFNLICPLGKCQTTLPDDEPMQFDPSHLTTNASNEIVQRMKNLGLSF